MLVFFGHCVSLPLLCSQITGVLTKYPDFGTGSVEDARKTKTILKRRDTVPHFHQKIFDIYMPTSSGVLNADCRNHSELYKDGVEKKEPWAMKMLDSSSKWSEGMLTGNIMQLGYYDECIKLEGLPSNSFLGQHCMISFSMQTLPEEDIAEQNPMINIIGMEDHKYENHTWSLCVPSTCPPEDVGRHFASSFIDAVATSPSNVSLSVDKVTCQSLNSIPEMNTGDYVAVSFFVIIFLLCILSTIYDLATYYSEKRLSILTAFSVYSNGRVLMTPVTDMMPALHGVRVLTRIWDELGQYYTRPNLTPALNADVLDKFYTDTRHVFITHYSNSIDTIFLLSGLLVAFNFMKERQLGVKFYLALFYAKRYIRFTPPFATMLLLSATLFRFVGDGPLWAESTEPMRERCAKTWWLGIFYLNNYIYPEDQCIPQGWFNCAEMQLVWLCPLVLFPLWKRPKLGKALLIVLIVACTAITFTVAYVFEVPVNAMDGSGANQLVYWPTHTRYSAWLIGLGVGYMLQEADLRLPHLSTVVVRCGWATSLVLLLAPSATGGYFVQPDYKYQPFIASTYICLMRPAYTLGLAWVVYACITGHGGFVNSVLSCGAFRMMSRSMYSFYLSHVSVRRLVSAAVRTPMYIDDMTATLKFVGGAVFAYVVSFFLCLIFEMPFVIMEQHFLGKIGHKEPSKPRQSQTSVASILHARADLAPSIIRDHRFSIASIPAERKREGGTKEEVGAIPEKPTSGVRFLPIPAVSSVGAASDISSGTSSRVATEDLTRLSAELVMSDMSIRSVTTRPEPSVTDITRSTAELVGLMGVVGSGLRQASLHSRHNSMLPNESVGEFQARRQSLKRQRSQEDRQRGTTELDLWENEDADYTFQERVKSKLRLHSTLNLKQIIEEDIQRQSADVEIIGDEQNDRMIRKKMIMDMDPHQRFDDNIFDFPSSSKRRESLQSWEEDSQEAVIPRAISLSRSADDVESDIPRGRQEHHWWNGPFKTKKNKDPTMEHSQDVKGFHWPHLKRRKKKVMIAEDSPGKQKDQQVDTGVASTSNGSEVKPTASAKPNDAAKREEEEKEKNMKDKKNKTSKDLFGRMR